MSESITIHIVFNAHIDPVWLWPLRSGIDEVLATCRSACDRLDAHHDLIFTRGEAWVYEQVERIDPALFNRIRKHVIAGKWEIVGGWYVQPDCNLPSGFGLARQIEIGRRFFLNRFGVFPDVAYNVDSFGHCATLPSIMRQADQRYYVMMRPQEHELKLPAALFRWREHERADEIITFRIPGCGYCTSDPLTIETVRLSLRGMVPGVPHTMLFAGIGDHGGGPTEEQIAWLRDHWHRIDGCNLQFSSPARFFKAIAPYRDRLPIVIGELQYHAIGCYSVHRPVKLAVRRAEHALAQAETLSDAAAGLPVERGRLDAAWKNVCLHHFHDALAGTCLPSAYQRIMDDLGAAASAAHETMEINLRRQLVSTEADPLQRIAIHNASDQPFAGYILLEPWLERVPWPTEARLLNEEGRAIPYQLVNPEANMSSSFINGLLFRVEIPAGKRRMIRIDPSKHLPAPMTSQISVAADELNGPEIKVSTNRREVQIAGITLGPIELHRIRDETDTWAHGIDRFAEGCIDTTQWSNCIAIEHGPLRAATICKGTIGRSSVMAEWRVLAEETYVELLLRVNWSDERCVLKLSIPMPTPALRRWDGVPGGHTPRQLDGREYPLRDWLLFELSQLKYVGIVCPDVFAVDVMPKRVRLTLVRSALMAHHEPFPQPYPRAIHSDQGTHEFRLRFFAGEVSAEMLDQQARIMQRPPLIASLTQGMPAHATSPKY